MHAQADTRQWAELRLAFLRHLPKRTEAIARRGRRFCHDGWDINGMSMLHDDVQRLAGVSGRYGVIEVSERLAAIESLLGGFLERESLPDDGANGRIAQMLDELVPEGMATTATGATEETAVSTRYNDSARAEAPPAQYWRRWSGDASPAQTIAPTTLTAANEGADPVGSIELIKTAAEMSNEAVTPDADAAAIDASTSEQSSPSTSSRPQHRIFHLTDSSALAVELDQQLETLGYELEIIDSAAELAEILGALCPDAVVVDAAFQGELESIGTALRAARERSGSQVALLAISNEDSVPVRLNARRAGASALLIDPSSVNQVLEKLRELLGGTENDSRFRILVVEDDRSQALFAESILRNAGMDAMVVIDAFDVLDAMDRFRPDLVLMDLYMPECDGTELTALIREREEFLNTPIVFLSGESDQDKHYEALSVGGDDFLSKPIRPKYLIQSVTNRVQRARALQQRVNVRDPRDPGTGLYHRNYMLDQISEALTQDNVRGASGGVLFLEIDGISALRDRHGLSGVEQLFGEVAMSVLESLRHGEIASRYSDGCLIVHSPARDEPEMEAFAIELRRNVVGRVFSVAGNTVRVRVLVGVCAFRYQFSDAGALLNAAERACREARSEELGVHIFRPPRRVEDEQATALIATMRDALTSDGFELLYQPIVALQGGEVAQYQTLLRLRDDSGQMHTAAKVVPLAIHHGLIVEIDRWVLTHALQVIEQRRQEHRPVTLYVSTSAASLSSPGQASWIAAQLQARRVEGGDLVLELPLDEISTCIDAIEEFCATLLPSGVGFCLSRFESGFDGDSILAQLPVQSVKLGRKYLQAAQTSSLRDELRVIVESAHRRGLSVIAQRVEDAQLAATLWMSGIDYIQGNLVQLAEGRLEFDFQAAVL